MASLEVARLWTLHEVDEGILSLQKRAKALDPGRAQQAELKRREEALAQHAYRALHAEQTDLNLRQKGVQEKRQKLERDLYGGSITSTREADAINREMEGLQREADRNDGRLMELMSIMPELEKGYREEEKGVEEAKAALGKARADALRLQKEMQEQYAELVKRRPELAKAIPPALFQRYEAVRKRQGTGMARLQAGSCQACGTSQPERTIVMAKEDKLVTCQSCGRILYFNAPS